MGIQQGSFSFHLNFTSETEIDSIRYLLNIFRSDWGYMIYNKCVLVHYVLVAVWKQMQGSQER